MSFRSPLPLRFALACSLLATAALTAFGQSKQKTEPADAPPALISMDGNAPKWKNLEELRRYAELGDAQAQFELGERLLNGDEVPRDPAAAVPLLEKAARNGVADAWFRLGKMYHDGIGVTRDYVKSFEHYTEAARRGVPEAQHNLGAMLVSARGVRRDYVEGLAWLIVATKSGAVSMAEAQTRERLAARPREIERAEARAAEILKQLKTAPDQIVPQVTFAGASGASSTNRPSAPSSVRPPSGASTPKKVEITAPPKLDAPKPQVSPSITLPQPKIEAPRPEPKGNG